MAPRSSEIHKDIPEISPPPRKYKKVLVWSNIAKFSILHVLALYGFYLATTTTKFVTIFFAYVLYVAGVVGVTGGAHRLWAHRAYKAKFPLKVILMIFQTIAYQLTIFDWVREHRVHHKFSETDADPHNAKRGLFFAHIGWALVKKHPQVIEKGKTFDFKDLQTDEVVAFQRKYYLPLVLLLCFMMPTWVPVYFWGETVKNSFFVAVIARFIVTNHVIYLVNSFAHLYGDKPYDRSINPTENHIVSILSLGEGWHNYHHTFPWDYKAAELGNHGADFTTRFIDIMANIGWAYELKTVSPEMIQNRAKRTGDGSHEASTNSPYAKGGASGTERSDCFYDGADGLHNPKEVIWGWDDKDLADAVKNEAIVLNAPKVQ